MTTAIRLDGVGKRYVKLDDRPTLLTALLPFRRETKQDFWALRGVSLEVTEGETVGILGHNGAGKSTLLRLLAGVTRPSEGSLRIRGRIAPLLSVGVGFHQEMTGRENIFVNGMLLGMSRPEVDRTLDEIIAFAELEEFIDTPVKFYSSGMYMRLGFSVAIHARPKVLLVDEVLAVGDIGFQLKCYERMRQLQSEGTTIVLVSHNVHAVRLLCPRALLISHGELQIDGETELAVARYHELMSSGSGDERDAPEAEVVILERGLVGEEGPVHQAEKDARLAYRVTMQFRRPVESPQFYFQVFAADGSLVYSLVTTRESSPARSFSPGETTTVNIPFQARLGGGTYRLDLRVVDTNGRRSLAHAGNFMMYVPPSVGIGGSTDLRGRIEVDGVSHSEHRDLMFHANRNPGDRVGG